MRRRLIAPLAAAATVVLVSVLTGSTASDEPGDGSDRQASPAPRRAKLTFAGPSHVTGVELEQCLVSLIDDVQVSAQEAGILDDVKVKEGAAVKAKQLVAQVRDARVRVQRRIADFQHQAARAQAETDVDVRYAKAQADVSAAEHAEAQAANSAYRGAVAPTEVRRLQLTAKRSQLGIEQAQMEHQVAGLTEAVRAAELRAARQDIGRRRVVAPLAGLVVEVLKKPGEWVQAGEPVLRVVRMNRLRIEGFVDASQFGDEEIVDCPVTIVVPRQRGEEVTFEGQVVFVNPLIEASGNYRVWAEVQNRQANGRWLLRPGMEAQMRIELKEPLPWPKAKNGKRI